MNQLLNWLQHWVMLRPEALYGGSGTVLTVAGDLASDLQAFCGNIFVHTHI